MFSKPISSGANGFTSAPKTNLQLTASDVEFLTFERFYMEKKAPLSEQENDLLVSNSLLTIDKRNEIRTEAVIYEFVKNVPLKEQKKRYGTSTKFREMTRLLLESKGISISERSFYRRLSDYKKDGIKALFHGLLGNNHARKIGQAEHDFLVQKYSDSRKYNISWIHRMFLETFDFSISLSAIRNHINQQAFKYETTYARHGRKTWEKHYANRFKLTNASCRDGLWIGDGTKLNLYYQDENGKIRADLQVTVVIDDFSRNIIGWHISKTETAEATFIAFKRALNYSGNKPYQFLYDNQAGIKSKQFQAVLDQLTHVHHPTAPSSPEAKSIELFFKHFQESDMRTAWNYTGQNITAKSEDSRANMDVILANKAKLPTMEGVIQQFTAMVESWNTRTHAVSNGADYIPQEKYYNSVNARVQAVTLQEIVEGFWLTKDKTIKYKKDGIRVTVNKELLHYEVQDEKGGFSLDFHRKHIDRKCVVKYDPENPESVWLYDESGRFLAVANGKTTHPRAIQDYGTHDISLMRGTIDKRKFELNRLKVEAEYNRYLEDLSSSGLSTKTQEKQLASASIEDSYYDQM